jgi:phosphopantothenoylcysteine synthetase/decarboxylase
MKRFTISLAAAMMIAGSAVFAQVSSSPVIDKFVSTYKADGFTRFEVRSGLTQVKIEAYRGDEKVEVILDKTSGKVLKTETGPVGAFDNDTAGVFIRERKRDFLRIGSDDDSNDDDDDLDDSDDDSSDDSDDDSNDDNDDDSNDDDSNDDDSNDDNGNDDSSDD